MSSSPLFAVTMIIGALELRRISRQTRFRHAGGDKVENDEVELLLSELSYPFEAVRSDLRGISVALYIRLFDLGYRALVLYDTYSHVVTVSRQNSSPPIIFPFRPLLLISLSGFQASAQTFPVCLRRAPEFRSGGGGQIFSRRLVGRSVPAGAGRRAIRPGRAGRKCPPPQWWRGAQRPSLGPSRQPSLGPCHPSRGPKRPSRGPQYQPRQPSGSSRHRVEAFHCKLAVDLLSFAEVLPRTHLVRLVLAHLVDELHPRAVAVAHAACRGGRSIRSVLCCGRGSRCSCGSPSRGIPDEGRAPWRRACGARCLSGVSFLSSSRSSARILRMASKCARSSWLSSGPRRKSPRGAGPPCG